MKIRCLNILNDINSLKVTSNQFIEDITSTVLHLPLINSLCKNKKQRKLNENENSPR